MNKILKAILPIMLPLVLLVTGCQPLSEPPDETNPTTPVEGTQVGELAPDFQLQNLDGQDISLSDLRGKPVLINFWASWCYWCLVEMPYLQEIYEEWSEEGLVLLAINTGESFSKVREFLESHGFSFPVLLDADLLVALRYDVVRYNKLYIPTTFFIDMDGIIQEKIIGSFPNKEAIEEHLGKIIP